MKASLPSEYSTQGDFPELENKMKMIPNDVAHLIAKHSATPHSSIHPSGHPSGRGSRRFPASLPRIAKAGLWLFLCAWFVPGAWPNVVAQTREQKPVATVGGEALYEEDFLPQIQGQVYKIRKQEYDLKRKALEDVINKKLMRAAAQKQGITEEEWLRREVDSSVHVAVELGLDLRRRGRPQVPAHKVT